MRVIFSKGRSIALTPPPEMLTKEIEDSQTRLSFLKGIAEELGNFWIMQLLIRLMVN